MLYFKRSNGDLRKCLLDFSNITIKSYSTYSHINKGEKYKKKSIMIPVFLKIFTALFLGILCFLLGCLFKEKNLQISAPKFNKDHLRILVEKESWYLNSLEYMNRPPEEFERHLIKFIVSIMKDMLINWEDICFNRNVRLHPLGGTWKREILKHWFDKVHRDIKNICDKISEECEIFNKGYSTDLLFACLMALLGY
ncbi:Plasmodium exported protein, unknown function [Plasmodium relictum]|uniref:Uncharacterized protein n=1 Tax=Plasmodium relictum TaxID=85471 RepID=A0A1J1GML1_PLARL|nr:Plasmodium exported protein, unknown function [Plasmodium relictum]CRG83983.1 Plasmodium exported protein, unknown function [Plasmodium relictum]